MVNVLQSAYRASIEERAKQVEIETPFLGAQGTVSTNIFPMFNDFYHGKHWQHIGVKAGQLSKPRNSKALQVVEGMTTFITDQRARVHFTPNPPADPRLAARVEAAYNWWVSKTTFDIVHTMAVRDSRKFGVGWLHLYADERAPLGQWAETVHPDLIHVAPNTTFDTFFCPDGPEYLIHEYATQVQKLRSLFPKADWGHFNPKWTVASGVSLTDRIRFPWNDTTAKDPTATCVVYEFWIRDETTVTFAEDIEGTDLTATIRKPKFPGGRRLIIAGGVVLQDEANPYSHGRFPFLPIVAYPESDRFYGQSDVGIVLSDVVMADMAKQQEFDAVRKSGGGKLLVNPQFGPDAKAISNAPLQILNVSDVERYMNLVPYATPPRYLSDMAAQYDLAADDASGLHDISRGISTPGNKSASEILTIAESDKTRVRSAARVVTKVNEQFAQMWLENLKDQKGEWTVYLEATTDEDIPTTLSPTDLKPIGDDGFTIDDEWVEFNVTVDDTSTLPQREQELYQRAIELFNLGLIPAEQVLEDIDYKPRFKIWAKQQAMEQEQAAMGAEEGEVAAGEEITDDMGQGGGMAPEGAQIGLESLMGMGGGAPEAMMGAIPPEMLASAPTGQPSEPLLPEVGAPNPMGSASDMALLTDMAESGEVPPEVLEQALREAGLM